MNNLMGFPIVIQDLRKSGLIFFNRNVFELFFFLSKKYIIVLSQHVLLSINIAFEEGFEDHLH